MSAINGGAKGGREKWQGGCTSDGVELAAKVHSALLQQI